MSGIGDPDNPPPGDGGDGGNRPATGTIVVSGTPAEGGVLTAAIPDLADPDGLVSITGWQWQEFNGTIWANIIGATAATFAIPADQSFVGKQVRAIAVTRDASGGTTQLNGQALTIANVDDEAIGTLTITGTAQEGGSLAVAFDGGFFGDFVVDPDGIVVSRAYQWQQFVGGNWTNIAGATASTYDIPSDQSLVGRDVRALVTTTDVFGGTTQFASPTRTVANVDDEATGTLSVTGTIQVGGSVTATLNNAVDVDGSIVSITYQWIVVEPTITGGLREIASGTGQTFDLNNPAFSGNALGPATVQSIVTTTDSLGGTTEFRSARLPISQGYVEPPNDQEATGQVVVEGDAQEGGSLTSSLVNASDPDGAFAFFFAGRWQVLENGNWIDIAESLTTFFGFTLLIPDDQSLVGKQVRAVRITRDVKGGQTELFGEALTIANVEDEATANFLVSADPREGGSLTASLFNLVDQDGTPTIAYQWQQFIGGAWTNIPGATTTTFLIPSDQSFVGRDVRLLATTTDPLGGTTDFVWQAPTITNVNDAPVITSAATANFTENLTSTVYQIVASDEDPGTTLTYSLAGTDAALFNVSATGAVTFKAAPNFEVPGDSGGNNVYDLIVGASDGTVTTTRAVAITVTNANEQPAITSAATASFAENGTGTVLQVIASDPDAGTVFTYGVLGTDSALFNISASGAVTFKTAPNFEAPSDFGGNNVYNFLVFATDGALNAIQSVTITVTNVNEIAPVITSAATANFAENGTGTAYQIITSAVEAGTLLTYSLTGTDAALFNVSTAGAVTFKTAPNFEVPSDAGGNNIYDLIVNVSDGTQTATRAVAITVTNVNEQPAITSPATASFAENGTATAYQIAATDPDAGTLLTYSLTGTDAALFNVSATGAVTFKAAPNFELPGDAGGNNIYDIIVGASDGTVTTTRAVAITVSNVNEQPAITSAATASFAENGTGTVLQVIATDPDAGTVFTYGVLGTDSALFNISASGAVTFKTAPNFEAPSDFGGNNVYNFLVFATDGALNAIQSVTITVTNVNEFAPVITSAATANFAENGTGTAYQIIASDADAGTLLTYSLTGTDAALFNVSATGAVTFKTAPNFEVPTDATVNGTYVFSVNASDGTLTTSRPVAIIVTNVNEAPAITSAATATFAENGTGTAYQVVASDEDAGTTLTYSLTGTDAALFNISAMGAVTFKTAPNFEAPGDAGGNNVYNIVVGISDGTSSATQAVAITVSNGNDQPEITSPATATFAENATGTAYQIVASDADAGTLFTYSLTGTDAALFDVSETGAVKFKTAPDFEAPGDAGGNNVYDLIVNASDGTQTATRAVAITVTNVNEAPTAVADTVMLDEGAVSGNLAALLLGNDIDPDAGDTRQIVAVSTVGTIGGVLFDAATQSLVYTASNFNTLGQGDSGSDSFTYTIVDANGVTSTATVTLSITGLTTADVFGTSANDMLDGRPLGAIMYGRAGDDIFNVVSTLDQVIEAGNEGFDTVRTTLSTYVTPDFVEQLVYVGSGDFTGLGNAGSNILIGGAGNDWLDGGSGSDTLQGGAGDDTYIVDLFTFRGSNIDLVIEAMNAGLDTVRAAVPYVLPDNVEVLYITGTGAHAGTGNNLDNAIHGNAANNILSGLGGNDLLAGDAGNDLLDGGLGADRMEGGTGNDTFLVDNIGDVVVELIGEGIDTIQTGLNLYSLSASPQVENLVFTGAGAFAGTGNGRNNNITGGNGDDVLDGGAGNDTLLGGVGNDILLGGLGVDRLDGGLGADILTGGRQNDIFVLSKQGADGDTITDFVGNGADPGDRLLLTGWGAGTQWSLTGVPNQLRIVDGVDGTVALVNVTGAIHVTDVVFG